MLKWWLLTQNTCHLFDLQKDTILPNGIHKPGVMSHEGTLTSCGNQPGCCGLLADGREPTWSPCDRITWAGISSSALVCTIVCLPRPWCKPQSLHCRTSSKPPGTSDEAGSLSQRWWRPASPEHWCAMIFEMLTTVPVSSVSLTGLPSPNWTHLWRESLPSPWWRGEDLAGLLETPTRRPLTAPTEEFWFGLSSSWSSGTMLWRPTTGPDEDGVFPIVPVKPWTPACPVICADRGLWCLDWSFSVGERTGLWDASSVGAPQWIVECWTASQWTGSLDLEWGLTSRSLWSSRETWAHWWSSGHAVAPVRENLHRSASHLSRRVASHLAALTALRLVVRAWWTREVILPIQRVDKWIGRLACWPQITDTSGRLGASGHVDRRCGCLWTLSTLDFWWLNGRMLASPSWSVELRCGGWEWKGRSPDKDLPSSWGPETDGFSTRRMSRWWPALWPPFDSKTSTSCWRSCRLFLVRKLMHWWVSFDGKWCPPRPRQCRWPGWCPVDSSTVGQSPPGELQPGPLQRQPAEEAEEIFLVLLRWSG